MFSFLLTYQLVFMEHVIQIYVIELAIRKTGADSFT